MKKFYKFLAVTIACLLSFSVAGCRNVTNPNDPFANEQVDNTRTQIYVFNFNGGYGADWLNSVKQRYEELHKDDVYEEGKKGVQIMVSNQKTSIESLTNQILDNKEEVYFTEYAYYYTLKAAGVLGDVYGAYQTAEEFAAAVTVSEAKGWDMDYWTTDAEGLPIPRTLLESN